MKDVIKTKLKPYLSSVYFFNQPVHVSGIFVAHHQEEYCIFTTIGTLRSVFPVVYVKISTWEDSQ